jgi:hypothetical protein
MFMSAHLNIQKHFIKCRIMSLRFSVTFIPFLMEYIHFFSSSVSYPCIGIESLICLCLLRTQQKTEALISSLHSSSPYWKGSLIIRVR